MRLNLGCGHDKRQGYVNVDSAPACQPDEVVDLEHFPWPWADDSVDAVLLKHVLEHLGADSRTYLRIIQELWRVCRHGAELTITVPHPRHDHFLNDPTHVRPITPQGLELFSQKRNREWHESGAANTPLARIVGVDFELASVDMVPDEPWRGRLQSGAITARDLNDAMRQYNNVIIEMTIGLRAIKPAGR